jgi:RimJ/RimL family protein N-acetyltransferase
MYRHVNGINVRKAELKDLPLLRQLKEDAWWGMHTTPFITEADQLRWFESLPPTTHCMLCDDGDQPAGFALLYDHNPIARTMKISGGMFEQARIHSTTKRCCTAQIDFAFEFFNLHRLEAEVLELNVVAQIYEIDYLGFMIEGRRRQAVYKLGQYYDSLYLGLLREEWGRDLDQLNLNVNKAAAQRWIERSRKKFGS